MPLIWDRIEDGVLVGLEAIQEMEEQVKRYEKGLEEVKDRHKGFSDAHRVTVNMKVLTGNQPHSLRLFSILILYLCVNLG
jgi:ABC-type Fe3+-hydroxamate transport system substrate-binding protein